ncbi:ATP-binding protein [Haloimpatiens sp. FM7330]|uniref:ATP-binding protein n=1 Tax=Haloimpatiens sp. FM7330 TaxID=3298610 RepID=UPI003634AE9E
MELGEEKCREYNNLLCVGIDNLNLIRLPKIIKRFIYNGLKDKERILIFTDNISYEDIEKNFLSYDEYINDNINQGNLRIKVYDSINYNTNDRDFLDILEIISLFKNKIRIIWDFKNIAKRPSKLDKVVKAVENIYRRVNKDNVKNLIYINNNTYDYKVFTNLCYKFNGVVIIDREEEILFNGKNEISKCIWLVQSIAQLKYKNNNLVLFNDELSSIPKTWDEEKFKNAMIDKIKNLCNVDFCVIYSSLKEKENILSVDSCNGITKKHKYHLINDKGFIKYANLLNKKLLEQHENVLLLNIDEINDEIIKNKFKKIDLKSCVGIYVEYYQNITGVICIGRYMNEEKIDKEDLDYMESICKTAFYLIQEQKNFLNMQSKLIENEKLRATAEMAAGIAHDLNNVLTPIVGSVQMLKEETNDKHIIKQLEVIEMCANDGKNITNKVKKITKSYNNKDEWEIFDIDNILLDCIDLTKDKWLRQSALNGIKIKVIPQLKSNSKVKGNITEIREVFINIISNAIDAMPKGGKIEILTDKDDKNVYIEMRDNGVGMNDEISKRVFEPFFTTKGVKGSGLGLSVSYKIIQSHGGNVKVESGENVGTSFYITLPICKIKLSEKELEVSNDKINFNGNMIVIDDQDRVRKVIADMVMSICKCKLKSCSCDNIEKELKRRKYDIVLCDFSMPNMDGLQVAQMAKKLEKNTYFCLMTGWVGNFDKSKLKNIDFLLNKPINKKKLKEMLVYYDIRRNHKNI